MTNSEWSFVTFCKAYFPTIIFSLSFTSVPICYAHDVLYLMNNSTVFDELEVSIVDLKVANAVLLVTRSGASKTNICDRQIQNWHRQLFKYRTVIPILMKFSQRVHTSLKTYK